jgi:hypothetical protein
MRSFDIFDTLVARRCVYPHEIFLAVETKTDFHGFVEMRRMAERKISKNGEYCIDDIYQAISDMFGINQVATSYLKAAELTEEFANLIMIRQHIAEVRPGDLLISDAYLPRSFVERVVNEKCGLHLNPIYISSYGKANGKAWKALTRSLHIAEHIGDNMYADVEMPRRYGVLARHTTVSQMTHEEELVENLGYRALARATREARLALWRTDPQEQTLGLTQIGLNFPLLFLTALSLIKTAKEKGWRHILVSSRDSFLILKLLNWLVLRLGLDIRLTYFFTSRIARAAPSTSYISYVRSLCSEKGTAVFDICGTGWSLTRLFEAVGNPGIPIFLMHYLATSDLLESYHRIAPINGKIVVDFITNKGTNSVLEALNSADHPMVDDVYEVEGLFIPRFVEAFIPDRYAELVKSSTDAFMLAMASVESISTNEIFKWLSAVRTEHIEFIHKELEKATEVTAEIAAQQAAESGFVMDTIWARAQLAYGTTDYPLDLRTETAA